MEKLIQLVYVSKAKVGLTESDLRRIFEASKAKNETRHLTGLVCYKNGHFVQFLEGDENEVLPLYGKILRDVRHRDCLLIHLAVSTKRIFREWTMGVMEQGERTELDLDACLRLRAATRKPNEVLPLIQTLLQMLDENPAFTKWTPLATQGAVRLREIPGARAGKQPTSAPLDHTRTRQEVGG